LRQDIRSRFSFDETKPRCAVERRKLCQAIRTDEPFPIDKICAKTGATIGEDTTAAGSKEREIEPRPPDGGGRRAPVTPWING
jgi:hypothetical protein